MLEHLRGDQEIARHGTVAHRLRDVEIRRLVEICVAVIELFSEEIGITLPIAQSEADDRAVRRELRQWERTLEQGHAEDVDDTTEPDGRMT